MRQPGDRIVLRGMRFRGRHGVSDEERRLPQSIELDVELALDLSTAGRSDELGDTADYAAVFETCRAIVEDRSFRLLEAIAETVATEVLSTTIADVVEVRVRKPDVPIQGELDHAEVAISRRRAAS